MEAIAEKDIEVVIDNVGEVSTDSALEVDVIDNTELAVSVNRKEFNIVGDELYIPKRYEDAPQWLRDLISIVTEESYARKITDLNNLSTSLQQLIVELDVAKNTYTQSIISSNDIDERINTAITTLNSSLSGSDATIVDLVSTKATPEEASAIALNTISSSINDGEIGALVGSISNTLATETEALANNIDLIHAEMSDGFEGTADAIQITQAYVGIDETGASTGTGLLADVAILQKQNDGVIETVTGTYDVMINPQDPNLAELVLTAEPYASWKAKDVSGIDNRLAHIGDVYIKYNTTSNGAREYIASYKFIRTTVDSTSPYSTDSDGFTWALIIDQAAQDAYQQSLNAYDLADNKRRVFTTIPTGPYDIGDLWIKQEIVGTSLQRATVGRVSGYLASEWSISGDSGVLNLQTVVDNIQAQVDSKVDTYYQDTLPFANAINVAKKIQAGDYWYCTLTSANYTKGKIYKYVESTNGSNYNYTWTENADITKSVFDLADGKASIFTTNSQPSVYNKNDMMIVTTTSFNNGTTTFTNGVVLTSSNTRTSGFVAADWTKKINDTEALNSFVSATYTPTVTSIQNQVDGKIESWYTLSTNDPKTAWTDAPTRVKHEGDMWYQTDTKRSYWYSSSTNSWNLIDDAKAIQALADAATAQATADGKISSYYMNTLAAANVMSNAWTATEKTNNIGDLVVVWDDSTLDNNGTWRWNGTNWVTTRDKKLIALASDVTNLSTELTNGTNTWSSADSTLENSLRTEITGEGARVESKFAYNSALMLNGTSYNSGFGIATSLTSGSGLPTGQSEFWIKADKFKLMSADGGKKSSYSPFTVDSVTGEINFNGKVTFSNVTNVPQLGSTPQEVVTAVNSGQTTTINGGRIETGSITASQIAANSISADRISSYNLTAVNASIQNGMITNAMIGDAQINNAKIANLSVDTIKIADQAVTIPFSVLNTVPVTIGSAYVTVASISTVSSGAPTTLTFSCNLSAGSLRIITARVIRNGTVLYDAPTTSVGQSAGQYGNLIFVLKDIPPVGTNTYVFDLYSSASSTVVTYASIIGLEVKK